MDALSKSNLQPERVHSIKRIVVDQLFGNLSYSYDLAAPQAGGSNLMIFYGDNGCGKTTLLRLVFYLLAPRSGTGYKGIIAKVPFRTLRIELAGGIHVAAERTRAEAGAFTMSLRRENEMIAKVHCKVDSDFDVMPKSLGYEEDFENFIESIATFKIDLFFVTDDRQLLSASTAIPANERYSSSLNPRHLSRISTAAEETTRSKKKPIDAALEAALNMANQRIRQQTLYGSRQGEADANDIYADIIERLLKSPADSGLEPQKSIAALSELLEKQAKRSSEFARLGLPSPTKLDGLIALLQKSGTKAPAVVEVLEPYIASLTVKLDALQKVRDSIFNLITALNGFFSDKELSFEVSSGITLTSLLSRERMSPSVLSSGEKQLLLLFCNTLIAQDRTSLFIIDEPELSLNIKWQRMLVDSLLAVTKNQSVQFILATHSFQILARYDQFVVELKPRLTERKHERKPRAGRAVVDLPEGAHS